LAAEEANEEQQYSLQFQAEMRSQLDKLTSELNLLADDTKKQTTITDKDLRTTYSVRILEAKAQKLNHRMQSLNVKWDAFNASYLGFISENDTLMETMTQAQLLKQSLSDTITAQQTKCQSIRDFLAAEQLIMAQDSIYNRIYKKAFRMSFIQKLTPQLEKLKAKEQAHFAPIQEAYDKAKTAVTTVPQLKERSELLSESFFAIKSRSEKIQQMQYMPLMQRFKDYLIGLACFAVIFMLFNNLVTKWQAAKQKKEALKKQAEMLKKQQNEYPTI
jgi:CRISPR/Cas system-associated protein endoribonuclease Cas2